MRHLAVVGVGAKCIDFVEATTPVEWTKRHIGKDKNHKTSKDDHRDFFAHGSRETVPSFFQLLGFLAVDDHTVNDGQNRQQPDNQHQNPVNGFHITTGNALAGPIELGFQRSGEYKADQEGWP